MRDYGKVAPQFWTGTTGKELRAHGHEAVIVGLYLMTSPHANMIGLYYLPVLFIAHETGLGLEGARKGLQRACEAGFCTYDEDSEYVFVHAMARFQIAPSLKPADNRCKGVAADLEKCPNPLMRWAFFEAYGEAFHIPKEAVGGSPLEAPSKPRAGAGTREDPPKPPKGGNSRKRKITLREYLDRCEADGVDPIPAADGVWKYPETMGFPADWIPLAWWAFQGRYLAEDGEASRKYLSWPQAFRNAVRENWLRLWWADGDSYRLTTTGVQAQRDMAAAEDAA